MGCGSSVHNTSDPTFHNSGTNGSKESSAPKEIDSASDEQLTRHAAVYRSVVPAPSVWLQSLGPTTVKVSWSHETEVDDSKTTYILEMETGSGKGYVVVFR